MRSYTSYHADAGSAGEINCVEFYVAKWFRAANSFCASIAFVRNARLEHAFEG
jgi:hypothetical protein